MPSIFLKSVSIPLMAAALLAATPGVAAAANPAACSEPATVTHLQGFAAAAARNAPAVVGVLVLRNARDADDIEGLDFFPPLSGPGTAPGAARGNAKLERVMASGFLIAREGWVVTTAHSVRDAIETWIIVADGRRLPARIEGADRRTDVAVLKLDGPDLPIVLMGRQSPLCPGEPVAAMGSPFGFDRTVTSGVVSAYPRFVAGAAAMPMIQTDVAINPGSSGGPLFDAAGYVVGMNSMLFSASGIYIGVSFALPIDRVLSIATDLRAHAGQRRGHIGITTQPLTPELARAFGLDSPRGALLVEVAPASRAAVAGLRGGDIVLAVNAQPVPADADLGELIATAPMDKPAVLDIWRRNSNKRLWFNNAAAAAGAAAAPRPAPAQQPAAVEVRLGLELAPPAAWQVPPGLYVQSASGSAMISGIEAGDRIAAVNGIAVTNVEQLDAALGELRAADVIALLLVRGKVSVYAPVRKYRR